MTSNCAVICAYKFYSVRDRKVITVSLNGATVADADMRALAKFGAANKITRTHPTEEVIWPRKKRA